MPDSSPPQPPILIAALYRFAAIDPYKARDPLHALCEREGVKGTLLLANEGINGTIAGSDTGIAAVLKAIRALPDCETLSVKFSRAEEMPFHRLKVRIKREIVTMGQPDIDPARSVGTYVPPREWNALVDDPDTILIDTRNDYEVAIGSFRGAIDPRTKSFREFPDWFEAHRAEWEADGRHPKIAMFCTGGIRCEKASSYLLQEGFKEVLQLQGGIQKYLREITPEESFWQGECFVFDDRVSLQHGLIEGNFDMCHACRMPIDENDKASEHYIEGVSCPHCYNLHSEERKERFLERQKQIELAKQREKVSLAI